MSLWDHFRNYLSVCVNFATDSPYPASLSAFEHVFVWGATGVGTIRLWRIALAAPAGTGREPYGWSVRTGGAALDGLSDTAAALGFLDRGSGFGP